jgi:crotonobetainyl-CoA:carnitine CoA-transferase CaiB-like acyl-CoA transferase
MTRSLHDITVLDLGHALSAPFATMLLAELGANIIKVEPPGGDHFRPTNGGATFAVVNRNKRSLCIDLKHPDATPILESLVRRADIVVENFTPGTAARLGCGYEQAKILRPDIIYASISGFGQSGPYRNFRGYDAVAQAMSGVMSATGEADRAPVRVGPSLMDMGTGMYLVIGVMDALRERDRTGAGAYLDFNLFESALSWMSQSIARYGQTGIVPERTGSALATFSPYQVFNGKDGQIFIGASTERFWQRLCEALDLQHCLTDSRWSSMASRVEHRALLTETIETRLASLSNDDALERLREAGVPCAPVMDVGDVVTDPHVAARNTITTVHDPMAGDIAQTRMPIGDGTPPQPAPALGEHNQEILAELGLSARAIAQLVSSGVVQRQTD